MPSQPHPITRRTFVKNMTIASAVCASMGASEALSPAPGARNLRRTTPEAVGIDSAAILAFVEAVEKNPGGMHSFMLLRHGQVAAEAWWKPYAARYPHMLYSLSKSFTSTAVGLAISEGRLTVDAPVTSFFPNDLPSKVPENLAAMRVRHLLTMSTGHDQDATGRTTSNSEGNWVKGFLSLPVEHEPGSKFVYNSAATYMLSAIVQKLTGSKVVDYLKPRLFDPIGIEGETWETCPNGINTGGWGLSVMTEDIARFGQLYLQKGKWGGKHLVPENWVNDATTKQVSNGDPATGGDWNQGYGYQFWRCRHGFFRGDGAFGQFCIVMPEHDAVLAITSGVGDMGAVMNAAWDHLLPGIRQSPIPTINNEDDVKKKLADLNVKTPDGMTAPPTAARVSGKVFRLEANDDKIESVALGFEGNHCSVIVRDALGERRMDCGNPEWVKGAAALAPRPGRSAIGALGSPSAQKVAGRGAWTGENTFTMTLCHYETPYVETVTCVFEGDKLTVRRKTNVGFGPTEAKVLVGRIE